MSYHTELEKDLVRISNMLEKNSKLFRRMANVTDDEEVQALYSTISTLGYFLGVSYKISLTTLNEINVLFSTIEKLPRKSEFDEIRNMVEKQKENIISTLIPIKEAFEKSTEYENFGRKMKNKKD